MYMCVYLYIYIYIYLFILLINLNIVPERHEKKIFKWCFSNFISCNYLFCS